jgi:hypothetical protein
MRVFLFLFFCSVNVIAQAPANHKYPQNYFRSPVDIPLFLAGNYGELRSNHFHAGIDVKTQGVEGKRIYAIADGFVSKIKIMERGYGKMIYVQHPNGYTSVYAHLREYFLPIEKRVQTEQYQKQTYTVEMYLLPHEFPVKKGDVLAFSGNSGGSVAPHLHFEIRETATDIPINPLLFNFKIADNVSPSIKGIRIFPLDENSTVNDSFEATYLKAIKKGSTYTLAETPKVHGKIGLGIEAVDLLSGVHNECGVYEMILNNDGQKVFEFKLEKIPSTESKYLNAHTDFEYRRKTGRWIHRSYVLPNNKLDIYGVTKNDGVLTFLDDTLHNIQYVLKDVYANSSKMEFKLKSTSVAPKTSKKLPPNFIKVFDHNSDNGHLTDDFKLYIPAKCLYQSFNFEYKLNPGINKFSNVHVVHNQSIPLHKEVTLSIKCLVEPANPTKLVAVNAENNSKSYIPGNYINSWFNFNSRNLGNYYLEEDLAAPVIKPLNFVNAKNISKQQNIALQITDDKSGINTYHAYLNEQWILMEYDYKKNSITHKFDGKFKPGVNKLKVVIADKVGNEAVYECELNY